MVKNKSIKKSGITIKYVNYNNKTRKGTYAYVKEGSKFKLYKVKPEIEAKLKEKKGHHLHIDNIYKEAFKSGLIKKGRTGVTEKKVIEIKKAKKSFAKKYANIEESLASGYAETTTQLNMLSHYNIKRTYINLLRNTDRKGDGGAIVKDDLLLNILTLPENVEKWKHRVLYQLKVYNDKDELLVTLVPDNIKTLVDIKREMGMLIKKGEDWMSQYREAMEKAKAYGYHAKDFKADKGTVGKINITLTYRKA